MVQPGKVLFAWIILSLVVVSGCSADSADDVPSDLVFVMDVKHVRDREDPAQNVNVRIDAGGQGRYERYDTGGATRMDANDMVTYNPDQVVQAGEFRLSNKELRQLWATIQENHFYDLTGDYQMAIGHSYAFIVVEANGQRHQVLNIGMQVPEIKAIVEDVGMILPKGIDIEYR